MKKDSVLILAICFLFSAGNLFAQDVELVSRNVDGKTFGTAFDSTDPVIGGDGADEGRYVAFISYAKGLAGLSGNKRQIVWRDRKTGEMKIVSHTPSGAEGNNNSFAPAISGDGRLVAFQSEATDLVPNDTNGRRDVFLWRAATNKVERVSVTQTGGESDGDSVEPTISGDGKFVAFSSYTNNLVPGMNAVGNFNIYLKDVESGAIKIVSVSEETKKGGGGSRPSISEDGSKIVFFNYAPLTKDTGKNLLNIYLWENGKGVKRLSFSPDAAKQIQSSESTSRTITPTISGDGKYVVFSSTATNIFPSLENPKGTQNVYWAEIATGKVFPLSVRNGSFGDYDSPIDQGERIAISYDGSKVLFTTSATNLGGSLTMRDLSAAIKSGTFDSSMLEGNFRNIPLMFAPKGAKVAVPSLSRNGKCLAFRSEMTLDGRFKTSGIYVACFKN